MKRELTGPGTNVLPIGTDILDEDSLDEDSLDEDILEEDVLDTTDDVVAPPPCTPPKLVRPPEPDVWSLLPNAPMPRSATVEMPSLEPLRRGPNLDLVAKCTFAVSAAALIVTLLLRHDARDTAGPRDTAATIDTADDAQSRDAPATGDTADAAGTHAPAETGEPSRGPRVADRASAGRPPRAAPSARGERESASSERAPTSRTSHPRPRGEPSRAGANPPMTASAPTAAPRERVAEPTATEPAEIEPAHPSASQVPATAAATPAAHAAARESCDEVSCVLERGDRACCAQYKPARKPAGHNARPGVDHAAAVADRLDRHMIQAGISRIKRTAIGCGLRHDGKGVVNVHVQVAPTGSVISVKVRSAPGVALGACVADAVRTATFAKTGSGGSFGYPFMF